MRRWLRRMRGILGIGAIWGLPASIVGAVGGIVASVLGGGPVLGSAVWGSVAVGGLFFLLGGAFATALTITEGRRTLDDLSPWRAAAWGGLAGAGVLAMMLLASFGLDFAVLLGDPQLLLGILAGFGSYGVLGAVLAGGTVAVARRAPDPLAPGSSRGDAELLDAPGDD